MGKKDIHRTKMITGVTYGDVSNQTIRNVLAEVSVKLYGKITDKQLEETLAFFDWKCPYTGRDLRDSIKNHDGSYVADHIVPQNREHCGLNIKGNVVYVDKTANSKKANKTVDEFLLRDNTILKDVPIDIRQTRLKKIKEFQKSCNYNPDEIKNKVTPLLMSMYDETRTIQENRIKEIIKVIEGDSQKPISTKCPNCTSEKMAIASSNIDKRPLNSMGSSWFISYAYHLYVDHSHENYKIIPKIQYRKQWFDKSKVYHKNYLQQIASASPVKYETNTIGLTGEQIINMARIILTKL